MKEVPDSVAYALGLIRILLWIAASLWLAKSVVKPDPDEHLRWYDRTLRAVGVLLLLAFLTFGIPLWLGWHK